jgi:NAD(P)-dependent dehydrogenase (short-subunit alcohol dehydrogenase family)
MSKKVLITGANGGFGKLTVESLLSKGHKVAATMRNTQTNNKSIADELKAKGAIVIELDVTKDESVNNGVQDAISQLGGLDVVINNAGVGVVGMQEFFTTEDFQKLFDINVIGVQRVNRAALPHLRSNSNGLIIYVSSLLGRICMPFYGPYNATKWALEALAENYRVELSGFGIENCIVEPGGYPTTFMTNLVQPSDTTRVESYGEFMNVPNQMFEGFGAAMQNAPDQKPQNVADAIISLIEAEKGTNKFRTVVDSMGMGTPIVQYNEQLDGIMTGLYSAFHMEGMLKTK